MGTRKASLFAMVLAGLAVASCSAADDTALETPEPDAAESDDVRPTLPADTTSTEPAPRKHVTYFDEARTLDGVEISLVFDRCNSDPEFSIEESPDQVLVTVIADDQSGPGDWNACADGFSFTLDEFIGDRPLINGATGGQIRLDIEFGPLSITDAPVEPDEVRLGRISYLDPLYGRCLVLHPLEDGPDTADPSPTVELVWPAGTTWGSDPDGGAVVVGPDGTSMALRHDAVIALRGSSSSPGPRRSDRVTATTTGCSVTSKWFVADVVSAPGVASFEAMDMTVADAVSLVGWPGTIGPDGDVPIGEQRLVPHVPTACGLSTLPFQVGGQWWTTIVEQMIDPSSATSDWFATETNADADWFRSVKSTGGTEGSPGPVPPSWTVGTDVPIDLLVGRLDDDLMYAVPWPTYGSSVEYRPAMGPPPPCDSTS